MDLKEVLGGSPRVGLWDTSDQLKWHVYRRSEKAFDAGDAARDAITSVDALKARQTWVRESFIESVGGLPPMDSPLNARITGVVQCDGYRIEKVIFESRPKTYVTGNMYIPDGITSPGATVLFLCGHWEEAKHSRQYQRVCCFLVNAGLVVFAQDPIGQGERFSYYDKATSKTTIPPSCYEHDQAGWQCYPLGDALTRYFVHDAMRSVDYLMTRLEVDPKRIGVTGNSGGGLQTCLMMLCEPRIAAAAPTTFLMDRRMYMFGGGAQDAEQIWPRMTALGIDHEDILLMMAPKPVQVNAVTSDFFPIEATRRTVQRCERFWEMHGKADRLALVEDVSEHCYTDKLASATAEFFTSHLTGGKITPNAADIEIQEASRVWCTKSGQVRGDFDDARAVCDENVDRISLFEAQRRAVPKQRGVEWLKERVFANRKVCELNPRFCAPGQVEDLLFQIHYWWSQEGIMNWCWSIRSSGLADEKLPVTAALWPGGTTDIEAHMDWITENCKAGRVVLVPDLTAMGALLPNRLHTGANPLNFYGAVQKLTDDLFWLDDSLAAIRVYDTIRLLDFIQLWPAFADDDIRFYTCGRYNVFPILASVLDKRIADIESVDPLTSYADWVRERLYDQEDVAGMVLPGILRHLDLPDIR